MREERILEGILETARHGEMSAEHFLRCARNAVLLSEAEYQELVERMAGKSPAEKDEIAARGWGETGLATRREGEYLLGQLRRQLHHAVCGLYAVGDLLDREAEGVETPPLGRLAYAGDEEEGAFTGRSTEPLDPAPGRPRTETFPRREEDLLLVPRPGQS